jgi:hypothetical protein
LSIFAVPLRLQPEINGKAFFVAGHRIIDLEDKLMETQPLWMGIFVTRVE